jgi:hypothetical protein
MARDQPNLYPADVLRRRRTPPLRDAVAALQGSYLEDLVFLFSLATEAFPNGSSSSVIQMTRVMRSRLKETPERVADASL